MTSLGAFNAESLLRDLALRATAAGYRPEALQEQTHAWGLELQALEVMTRQLIEREPRSRDWTLLLEYEIPRRQRRIDKVVLADSVILVLEFKIGATAFNRDARWQAEDYASDLRDYHAASQNYPVIPFLIATGAETPMTRDLDPGSLQRVGEVGLAERILEVVTLLSSVGVPRIDPLAWDAAAYRPTPSVIEATQLLFSHHTVRDLSHAYADNLTGTVNAVVDIVQSAQRRGEHVVCFVTGVPGAGKTLAGLVGVHDPSLEHSGEYRKAFLSGNSPLVKVLRGALIQDAVRQGASRQEVQRRVETVVQNVHAFLEEHGVKKPESESIEHVIVFDEAQRAWNAAKLTKRHPNLHVSEPALVLDVMSRKRDWSVVVALVGGGQEIHTGEAGLEEWGRAVASAQIRWRVVASPEVIVGGTAVAHHRLFEATVPEGVEIELDERLHLSVSVRSPRAQWIAEWVNAVLDLRPDAAREVAGSMDGFRLGFTRDLEAAKGWLRDASRRERRPGLLASSGSLRHRAYGIEMAPEFLDAYPISHWFLGASSDVRSSYSLEVAMSEFKCQGLEVDWVGLCWGDDLTIDDSGSAWSMREFRGAKWRAVNSAVKRRYLLNKYRVLMTRAREGMIIWVPPGDARDETRDPKRLNQTAAYLGRCGLQEVW